MLFFGNAGDEFNTIIAATAFNIKKFLYRDKARLRNWIDFYIYSTIRFIIFIANLWWRIVDIKAGKRWLFQG